MRSQQVSKEQITLCNRGLSQHNLSYRRSHPIMLHKDGVIHPLIVPLLVKYRDKLHPCLLLSLGYIMPCPLSVKILQKHAYLALLPVEFCDSRNASYSLFQFEGSDIISVLRNSIVYSFVFFKCLLVLYHYYFVTTSQ